VHLCYGSKFIAGGGVLSLTERGREQQPLISSGLKPRKPPGSQKQVDGADVYKYYSLISLYKLQGRVRFPTGGIAREPQGMIW